jgi:hypothetical protein
MATRKKKASGAKTTTIAAHPQAKDVASPDDVAGRFIGQWNRLVSTTNWEKGRIICQWREALELAGAAATECSDEAWAQLVGGVTSQHVGRLRRVFQRFGAVFDQYEGLYWSHFQAGLDWDDAEMWLEGAIHNSWSISQMRGKRWETLGNVGDPPTEEAADALIDDGEAASAAASATENAPAPPRAAGTSPAAREKTEGREPSHRDASESDERDEEPAAPRTGKTRKPLAVDVDDLPDDLAEASEQFKLAIIAQRRAGWRETTPTAVIECLDALKELALAPADD